MKKIEGVCREVVEKSEWVAIATAGSDGPHVVATWGDYLNRMGLDGETLRIPVGGMRKTEANLRNDPRVELLFGTRQVRGNHSSGKGCSITGRAEMRAEGPDFEAVKATFPWARAVLLVRPEKIESQL